MFIFSLLHILQCLRFLSIMLKMWTLIVSWYYTQRVKRMKRKKEISKSLAINRNDNFTLSWCLSRIILLSRSIRQFMLITILQAIIFGFLWLFDFFREKNVYFFIDFRKRKGKYVIRGRMRFLPFSNWIELTFKFMQWTYLKSHAINNTHANNNNKIRVDFLLEEKEREKILPLGLYWYDVNYFFFPRFFWNLKRYWRHIQKKQHNKRQTTKRQRSYIFSIWA